MSDHLSGGELSGYFAGVVALLATLGGGIRWLLNWKARRADSLHAKLLVWEDKLTRREARLDAEQAEHFRLIEARLTRAELRVEATLNGYHLIAGALRSIDPSNAALGHADEILKAAFQLDPIIPEVMKVQLGALDNGGAKQ